MLHFKIILLSLFGIVIADVPQHQSPSQAHMPSQSLSQTSQDLAPLLPLMMATAHAIQSQDDRHTALSCILISDSKISKENMPKSIFAPCDYYSLSAFRDKGFTYRYDLAMIVLQPSDTVEAVADIVVSCRDLSARHVLAVVPSLQNLTAFGFAKVDFLDKSGQMLRFANTDYTAWQFNLFDYKQLPDWFNSRFWANPENWNKFRW